ncbi:MAG: UDP-N-acetylmuramoyl-tripeptide--D-alanyl-D-alanine ligase [Candidatus Eremiobacteraeota bacterium]|nr:UDP-N-acetylmuramoyl-tripeptide--D-alanyl-D-alanine ligase [Candidatus Eremiobacteraeota bacterium]
MPLTFEEAVQALGTAAPEKRNGPAQVMISTDSRTLQNGETFLALRGERFDGHQFVDAALERGAAALIVESPPKDAPSVPTLVVSDTLKAYMQLAAAERTKLRATVLAITGSNGKTTTKALLGQLLQPKFGDALAISPANENNEIGVSKLLLNAPADTRLIVVEMGARHYGDIAALVNIARPQIGVLTNVREAHLEIMESVQRLADTKWALFSQGARAVLNSSDSVSLERARMLQEPPRWFGSNDSALPAMHARERGVFLRSRKQLRIVEGDAESVYDVDVRLPGDYNLDNLAAAIAAAIEIGCEPQELIDQLPNLTLPAGRYETIRIAKAPRIIFDAYNASASGTIATLDAFAKEDARRRIAVLGSMAELGAAAPELHQQVGAHAAKIGIDYLLLGGDNAEDLQRGAQSAGFPRNRISRFHTAADAAKWIRENASSEDAVLLKASRRYRLEQVVEELR